MTLIYFLLLLTVIICIHELGHLIAAKIFGVYCFEYSFGMGPVIFRKQGKETVYSIRAIPIGGFVAMAGETDGDEAYPDVTVPAGRRIIDVARWKRVIIMLAGVFMNFVLAITIFSLIILRNGYFAESPEPVINEVVENSPADLAGFEPGDRIIYIENETGDSIEPEDYTDLQYFLSQYSEQTLTYTVERGEETMTLTVQAAYDEEAETYRIGIVGSNATIHSVNFLNCWYYGLKEMILITKLMVQSIRQLIFGNGLEQVSGPIGIYSATETYVSMGFASYMFLIAELSLNVGIFNLLPLPILDGGQVVTTVIEGIIGKPLNQKLKTALMIACWMLLLGVMIFATWNDIVRLFN